MSYGWTNYTTTSNNPMGGMNDGNSDKGDYLTKGIKADNQVNISAGNIVIKSYDDCIHVNNDTTLENGENPLGNVNIAGGNLSLYSNDDGIHGDGTVLISGGTLDINHSYEGIEGNVVKISGGNINVLSSDDGINGSATTGQSIIISGGYLYVYAGGDGVDSNSKTSYDGILFSGGHSVIISTGSADSSIDTEQGYKYSGGYVVAIGRSGGMSSEATKSSPSISSIAKTSTLNLQSGNYLVISNVVTIKMNVSFSALVVCLGNTEASIYSSTTSPTTLDSNGVCWSVK